MTDRSRDWFAQAERDLELGRVAKREGMHDWACFAAQQSAEKAVKAIHLASGQDVWGHVVRELLEELHDDQAVAFLDRARVLDGYYIPARYPNGHPSGASFEHYGKLQSEQAIAYAQEIIEFARSRLAEKR
jgi:HEPN domain-containing protein